MNRILGNCCFAFGATMLALCVYADVLTWLAGPKWYVVALQLASFVWSGYCMYRLWRLTSWGHRPRLAIKTTDVITMPDVHSVKKGERLAIYGSADSPIPSGTYVVTSITDTTVTLGNLLWYERLAEWLKRTFPKRDYRHRLGVLHIQQAYSSVFYVDEIVVVPNTPLGRAVQRFYNFLHKHNEWIRQYDIDTLGLGHGDFLPWWSASYWWAIPFRFANRFFPRITGYEASEWPERFGGLDGDRAIE